MGACIPWVILILNIPVLPLRVIGIVVVILTLQFGTDVVPELIVHLHQPIQFAVYQLNVCCHVSHSVPLREKSFTKIYPDMGPLAKLSYRSAIHKKVVFGPG